MATRQARTLVRTATVDVVDVRCGARRARRGDPELSRSAHLVLPRRGVFVVHRRGEAVPVDVNTALLLGRDDEYAVSHPSDGGDHCVVLAGDPVVFEDAFHGAGGGTVPLGPPDQLALRLVAATARCADGGFGAEEVALGLLGRAGDRLTGCGRPVRVGRRQRARVAEARAALAAAPAAPWDLARLGRAVHCSPFYLARQFRAVTGETIARYLLRLRLAEALDRLADGDDHIGRLAADLGFAHHSHLTARFRAVFGLPPSAARTALTRPVAAEMRRIVTAPPDGRSLP